MKERALRTSLRDEVKLESLGLDSRGVRAWTAVELPGRYWVHAVRTEVASNGALEKRQWLTCDFWEAMRYGRGEHVTGFALYAGVFSPSAASGFLYGEVNEVLMTEPAGAYFVKYGSGLSVVVNRGDVGEVPSLANFRTIYHADTWRG